MITAYAQNFEDVLLWRALCGVEKGRYVDVGAHDPDFASVTRLFYEHGWRGINIEPVPEMYEKLVERRPEDRNIQALAGDHARSVTFFEAVGTGLSTGDPEHAQQLRDDGWKVVEHTMPMVTLDAVLEEAGGDPIQFLKIDVEGAEAAVLAGLDLSRWRPWILVIEATAPLTTTVTDAAWADLVLSNGYRKVYFDGLNDYFVAEEHADLGEAFGLQPNVFDSFVMAADHGLVDQQPRLVALQDALRFGRELDAERSIAHELDVELQRSRAMLTQVEGWAQASENWARSLQTQLERSELTIQQLTSDIEAAHHEALARAAEIEAIRGSTSWRVTAPLRAGTTAARSTVKAVARPVLDRGLAAVRGNEKLRAGLRKLLRRVPGAEARFQGYANARPVDKGDVE